MISVVTDIYVSWSSRSWMREMGTWITCLFYFTEKMEIGSLGLGIKNMDWVGKLDPAERGGGGSISFEPLNKVLLTSECTGS